MKKTIISIVAALMMVAGASAQQATQAELKAAAQLSAEMEKNGVPTMTITKQGAGGKTNVTPRHASPPARRTPTGGQAKAGQQQTAQAPTGFTRLPDGTIIGQGFMMTPDSTLWFLQADGTYALTPPGVKQQPVQQVPVQQQQQPVQQTLASVPTDIWESQLTGTILTKQADGTYDYPGSGRVGATASVGGGSGGDDPLMFKKLAPNELVYDRQGNRVMDPISLEKLRIRRGYDNEGNPTAATVAWMENRNGGLGRIAPIFGVSTGVYAGGGVMVNGGCNTNSVNVSSGCGPAGYHQWEANQFWNKPCYNCR